MYTVAYVHSPVGKIEFTVRTVRSVQRQCDRYYLHNCMVNTLHHTSSTVVQDLIIHLN